MGTEPNVSDAEMHVLKALWNSGPCTVRMVESQLRRRQRKWAYNTVLTLLSRLREKGFVASDKSETAHVFRAVVSREQLVRSGLTHLAKRLCDGTASTLVHALVQDGRFSTEEIAHFRKLLDELDPKG